MIRRRNWHRETAEEEARQMCQLEPASSPSTISGHELLPLCYSAAKVHVPPPLSESFGGGVEVTYASSGEKNLHCMATVTDATM